MELIQIKVKYFSFDLFVAKINNIHQRELRIIYQDKKSSFKTLLKHDKSMSIHMKNLQYLATELFKVKNGLSPEIMK